MPYNPKEEMFFKAVLCSDRLPQHSMFYHVLIDGRLPMVCQLYPDGKWMTSGMSKATEMPKVTHWFEYIDVKSMVYENG